MLKTAIPSIDTETETHHEKPLYAKEVMTTRLQFAQADWSLRDLGKFFVKTKISGAPVTDEHGTPVGVVSITDLAQQEQYNNPQETLADVHRFYDDYIGQQYSEEDVESLTELSFLSLKVKDIMTPQIITVEAETTAQSVAKTLVSEHVHRVLVTDKGQLVGIISSLDLLRYFR